MGDGGVEGYVVEKRPFVWPANFSLLAKGLQSQGRESLLLHGEAGHQKQCDPVQVPCSVRMVVWVQIPCHRSSRAHPKQERFTRAERVTRQIYISNWSGDERQSWERVLSIHNMLHISEMCAPVNTQVIFEPCCVTF